MYRAHPTLAAFVFTGTTVALVGFSTGWRLWLLYVVMTLLSLFVLSRLFAGLPLNSLGSDEDGADKDTSDPRNRFSPLPSNDMAGIGAAPDNLARAYRDWTAAKQGDLLADPRDFEQFTNPGEEKTT